MHIGNFKKYLLKHLRILFYFLAFLLPFFEMLRICKATGTYPFGSGSWLVCDMDNQYIAYFSYFKQAIKENGFFYTFSKTLGGDMLGFTAYYLMSPLNLLLLLVPTKGIHDMVAWISLIKIGLCGLTFYILADYRKEAEEQGTYVKSCANLIFSTAYALMTYNIFYISNIMWFDAVYILPLVILGIQRLIKERKYLLYIVSLAYALLTNYYIGYMICIFSVLYFVGFFIFEYNQKWKAKAERIGLFAISSLLAGGLSMWCFLPAKTSLDGVKAGINLQALTWDKNFGRSELFVKLLPGSSEDLMAGLPNIYCGIIVVFFSVFFFLSSRIDWKKKIGMLVLLGIMYCSFYIRGLNLIWHGFNSPIGFPYRNSFLFSFLLILIARDGFLACINEKASIRIMAAIGSGAAIAGLVVWLQRKAFPFLLEDTYKITLIAAGVCLLIAFLNQKRMSYIAAGMGLLLLLFEMHINGVDIYENRDSMITEYLTLSVDQTQAAVDLLMAADESLYRVEKNFSRNTNDNMMYGIRGLSHYSSTEKPMVKTFMQAAGFYNNGNWTYYNRGSTLSIESFLGVKYLLSQTTVEAPYTYVNKIDGTYIYENPYAFSMAFLTDAEIEDVQVNLDNTFEFQNALLSQTCAVDNIFIRETDYETALQNLKLSDGNTVYQKIDENQEAYIEYSFTVEEAMPVYMYLNTNDKRPVTIQINDVNAGAYFTTKQHDVVSLNDYLELEVGDTVRVRVIPQTQAVVITDVLIYYEDAALLEEAYIYQKEGAISLEKSTDSQLRATFSNTEKRSRILFTIPYDNGWSVYVDGKKAETYQAAGIFLAVGGIEEGSHTLTLKYIPENFILGVVISLVSLTVLILLIVYACHKDKEQARKLRKQAVVCCVTALGITAVYLIALPVAENREKLHVNTQNETENRFETILFGRTEQDGNTENGAEPIEWIILEKREGKALVVSRYALAYLPYSTDTTALWESSDVRGWLSQDFYISAFSEAERKRIEAVQVDNRSAGSRYVEGGNATEDSVFLLSRQEIGAYFGANVEIQADCFYSQAAICEPTWAAVLQSAENNTEYYTFSQKLYDNLFEKYGYDESVIGTHGCSYWLRNPGRYAAAYTAAVGGNGDVFDVGTLTTKWGYVRPAMWVEYEE